MYVGESSVSSSSVNHNVSYDYDDKKADSGKVPKFNGDPEEFSWWKTNFYSYVMGKDEELWDILEDGIVTSTLMKKETYSCSEEYVQETSQDQRITCSCYTSCREG